MLYALHGKTQNNASFMDEALSLRKAMAAGALEPSIIVTPDSYSTGRWENRETGPAEDNFIKYLIPHVEQNYRVRPGPSYRLLAGFSMGGHGALRFGLKYPEMFAAVWSVDGAMASPDNYLPFVEGKALRRLPDHRGRRPAQRGARQDARRRPQAARRRHPVRPPGPRARVREVRRARTSGRAGRR